MTLPFRRRHNDQETSHDRARALIAAGFTEPVDQGSSAWLEDHLAGCAECVADRDAWAADRGLFEALRSANPRPPRDLWARTSVAIEREARRRARGTRLARPAGFPRTRRVPFGAASGLLVVAVVGVASLISWSGIPLGPAGSDLAGGTRGLEPTPLNVVAYALAWVQTGADGGYEFRRASVDSVCQDPRAACATLDGGTSTRLALTNAPRAVVQSPTGRQIVVVTSSDSSGGTEILVVNVPPLPTDEPGPTPSPTSASQASPSLLPPTALPTPTRTATPAPISSQTPTPSSTTAAEVSEAPSVSPEPVAGLSIISGVVVVGDAAYSPNGEWLAFSARPLDGMTGPDLYLWHAGDELATAVTSDHRTFLAGWLGNRVLANRIEPAPKDLGTDTSSVGPSSTPDGTANARPLASPVASGAAAGAGSPEPSTPAVLEEHPTAFTLDPETGQTDVIVGRDMWRPSVDPTGRSVVYWSGTLIPDGTGTGWSPGTGQLVIDGWHSGVETLAADGSPRPTDTSPADSGSAPTGSPAPSAADLPSADVVTGPAGHPVALSQGPVGDFDASFDPTGRLAAVWIADPAEPTVGTLRLIVLTEDGWGIDATIDPLPGVTALRGVSINLGRLAWVTPPGQNGEGSHVQVLGWNGRDFGQVRSIQADKLFVAR